MQLLVRIQIIRCFGNMESFYFFNKTSLMVQYTMTLIPDIYSQELKINAHG